MHVVALIHKDRETQYGISFPDFPGCISAGDTLEDAILSGTEALSAHLAWMAADGDSIAVPRSIDDLRANPEFADDFEDAILATVSVSNPSAQPSVEVSLEPDLLKKIDHVAHDFPGGRNAFLAEAAREKIARVGQS